MAGGVLMVMVFTARRVFRSFEVAIASKHLSLLKDATLSSLTSRLC